MAKYSERVDVADVDALTRRSEELFDGVPASTVALWLLATRAGRMTEAFTREVLTETGLEPTGFGILVVLLLSPAPHRTTMRDLADAVVLSQPGVTRALQRAERDGHVRKLPDSSDGRAVVIELTAKGRNLVEKAMRLLFERFEARLGPDFSGARAMALAAADAAYCVALEEDHDEDRDE